MFPQTAFDLALQDAHFSGRKLEIYIAAPYTGDGSDCEKEANVAFAIDIAEAIVAKGHIPYIPHLTHFWDLQYEHPYEFWLDYDLKWLEKCDAVLRVGGMSKGADKEVEFARQRGITVYEGLDEIPPADMFHA